MIAWNLTGQNLCVFVNGRSFTMPRTEPNFDRVMDAIEDDDEDTVLRYVDAKADIEVQTSGRIAFDGYNLTYNGEPIHNAIVDRLHYLWSNKLPYNSLLRFMDRLMENPSYRAVKELYRFLEACELPITNDGYFLAYKRVRHDYTDIHSGRFDNSVGTAPRIRRNEVDEDSTRTCSYGLHVCSAGYLPRFGGFTENRDRIVVVKVDPQDVVAVPQDYNNSKMRVCGYEVVADVTEDFYDNGVLLPSYHTSDFADSSDDEVENPNEDFDDLWDAEYDVFDHDDHEEYDDDDADDDPFAEDEDIGSSMPSVGPSIHATNTTLNEHAVREIKDYLRNGNTPIVRIAEVFGVDESTIRKIRDGKTWAWVI